MILKEDIAKLLSTKRMYISITLSDDEEIKSLNHEHLGRDYTTDVLSFPMHTELEDGTYYLGDIVVNKEQAIRQSAEYGNDVEHEIAELVEHGVLHLLEVHHSDDDNHTVHGIETKNPTL